MAKFLSQLMTIGRGSIGGLTLTANQFHQLIIRAKTAPVQPNTHAQTDIKTAFTSAENQWETLSAGDQDAWNDYANATPYSGPLGNYTITGRLMFHAVFGLIYYMNNTLGAGLSVVPDAPPNPGFSQLPDFAVVAPPALQTGVSVSATIPIGQDDLSIFAQRSIAYSATRKRFKGPWKSATNQAVDFAAGVPSQIDFVTGLIAGDIIFMHLRGVRTDDPHRIAQDIILRGIAEVGV